LWSNYRAAAVAVILKKGFTMNDHQFQEDARDYALELVENGLVSADHLLLCALKYMSVDAVRDMLDANELSPRFSEEGAE
jgi:hypothetical protein